nr:basic proline-rich protein-like [Oryctolagus cuniculus]
MPAAANGVGQPSRESRGPDQKPACGTEIWPGKHARLAHGPAPPRRAWGARDASATAPAQPPVDRGRARKVQRSERTGAGRPDGRSPRCRRRPRALLALARPFPLSPAPRTFRAHPGRSDGPHSGPDRAGAAPVPGLPGAGSDPAPGHSLWGPQRASARRGAPSRPALLASSLRRARAVRDPRGPGPAPHADLRLSRRLPLSRRPLGLRLRPRRSRAPPAGGFETRAASAPPRPAARGHRGQCGTRGDAQAGRGHQGPGPRQSPAAWLSRARICPGPPPSRAHPLPFLWPPPRPHPRTPSPPRDPRAASAALVIRRRQSVLGRAGGPVSPLPQCPGARSSSLHGSPVRREVQRPYRSRWSRSRRVPGL